jgi:hypothetical protein
MIYSFGSRFELSEPDPVTKNDRIIDFIFFFRLIEKKGQLGLALAVDVSNRYVPVPLPCTVLWIHIVSRYSWVSGSGKTKIAPPTENG